MADNVEITAGAGTPISTDEIGGKHYQRIKIADGVDDSTAMIGGDAANGLDVDVTRIAAGDNNIGNVDVVTLPAIPAGTNLVGKVGIDQATVAPSLMAKGKERLATSSGRLWICSCRSGRRAKRRGSNFSARWPPSAVKPASTRMTFGQSLRPKPSLEPSWPARLKLLRRSRLNSRGWRPN